jgi:hypothetical protein
MSLSISITAGKTLARNERANNAKLNALGLPTMALAGTASTAQLGDDTVTPAKAAFGPWFYGAGSGSAIAHVVDISGHTLTGYVDGLIVRYRVGTGNSTVTTLAGVTLTSSGTTATVTATHSLKVGDKVMVSGATPDDYNGTFRVASVTGTTSFTYVFAGSATLSTTGNVRYSAVGGMGSFIQTSGVTVNVAGLGAKNLFGPAGTRLMPGEIITGEVIEILYNGTSDWFEILSRETASEVIRAVDNSPTPNAYAAQATDGRTTLEVNNTLLVCRMALGNTATATLTFGSISGTIRKNGLTALTSGDIVGGQWCQFIWDGTYWQMLSPAVPASARATVPVRQTVLTGPVDSSTALPVLLTITGASLAVTLKATSGSPLVVTFAAGFDASGAVDYISRITADVASAWTVPAAAGTYYLYADRNTSTGSITYNYTSKDLIPRYADDSPTSAAVKVIGQHTFLINEMQMYVGDGSAATAVQRTFIGHVVTNGTLASSVVSYMFRGQFQSGTDQTLAAYNVDQNFSETHRLGLAPRVASWVLVCIAPVADAGYVAGDQVDVLNIVRYDGIRIAGSGSCISATALTVRFPWSTHGNAYLINKGTYGVTLLLTVANWQLRAYASRGW